MFTDVLVHHVVVELKWVLVRKIVINLTALGFNHIGLLRARNVSQLIILGRNHFAAQKLFVFPGCVLLLDETLGG